MLRGKKVDAEIIKMLEAYIELYNTLDFTKWGAYGGKKACRMCKLVGMSDDYITDCYKCPLYAERDDYGLPCVSMDNTGLELEVLIYNIKCGRVVSECEKREIIKARMKTLYNILKANGYFD